jgi:hypothetical protein
MLLAAGCFRAPLPGPVAPLPAEPARPAWGTASGPLVLLIQEPIPEWTAVLGHQFALGIVPVTRIVPEKSTAAFAEEMLLDHLLRAGYRVAIVPRGSEEKAAALLCPEAIITASLPQLSVNAYDALFFRIVSITGEIEIRELDRSAGDLHQWLFPFESTSYRRFAFLPLLSYELERAMRQALLPLTLRRARNATPPPPPPPPPGELFQVAAPDIAAGALRVLQEKQQTHGTENAGLVRRSLAAGINRALVESKLPFAQLMDLQPVSSFHCPARATAPQLVLTVDAWTSSPTGERATGRIYVSPAFAAGMEYECRVDFSSGELQVLSVPAKVSESARRMIAAALAAPAASEIPCEGSNDTSSCCRKIFPPFPRA